MDSGQGAAITKAMFRTLNLIALASALSAGCAHSPSQETEMSPPEEKLAGQLYAEIWADLRSNAMIGNGNWLAARWANAGSEQGDAPQLHIQNLLCRGSSTLLHCRFGLLRDGGVATYLGEPAPDRLACTANFQRSDANGRWSIPRKPPGRNGGHSRNTIKCQSVT